MLFYKELLKPRLGLGLACPKAMIVIPKLQLLPNDLQKKTSNSVKYRLPLRYKKKRPVKIIVYLGLDIIIKSLLQIKHTKLFDYSILFYPITLEGHRGTTDEFATIPFHLNLFSAALVELAKGIKVFLVFIFMVCLGQSSA